MPDEPKGAQARFPYPKDVIDLRQMNRALRHKLRNLCAGVKMTIDRISDTAGKSSPQLVDRCRIIKTEMDSLQRFTERLDLLFDALPQQQPKTLFEIVSFLRESFVKGFPYTSLELDGPEIEAGFPKGSWLQAALLELLLNAGEGAGLEGKVRLAWALDSEGFSFSIENGGAGIPPEIPLDPPVPFHTPKSRHDGIGLAIVHRICKEAPFRLDLSVGRSEGASASIRIPSGDFLNGQA
jgi:signal transduction histidine kinase